MRTLLVVLSLLAFAGRAVAREVVMEMKPAELQARGWLRLASAGSTEAMVIENPGPGAATIDVLDLPAPAIGSPTYAITGEVRHDALASRAFLEMWSSFPDGSSYFSRTLGSGPLQPLRGRSDWREFVLPFHNQPGAPDPRRLKLDVVFGGPGRVELRALRLVRYARGEDPVRAPGQWWSDRQAGLMGGVAGALLGLLGAMIGSLAGAMRARTLVLGALRLMATIGAIALAVAIVALLRGQSYVVWYPLLIVGAIGLVVGISMEPGLRRRYDEAERRAGT